MSNSEDKCASNSSLNQVRESFAPSLFLIGVVILLFRVTPDSVAFLSAPAKVVFFVTIIVLLSAVPVSCGSNRSQTAIAIAAVGISAWLLLRIDFRFLLQGSSERSEMYKSGLYWSLLVVSLFLVLLGTNFSSKLRSFSITSRLFYSVVVVLIAYRYSSFLPISLNHPYLSNANDTMVVFNPIIQTNLGKGVNFDLFSIYGDYAFLLSPIFYRLTPSVENITLVFAIINFFCLVLYGRVISLANRSQVASSCYFLFGVFIQYSAFTIWPADKYFQVYPLRMFFPLLAAWAIYEFLEAQPRLFAVISPVISCAAIIWNRETGFVCCLSLFTAVVMMQRSRSARVSETVRFLIIFGALLVGYMLMGYLRTGHFFSLELFLKPFGTWGFKLEVIRWNGIWPVFLILYAFGLHIAIRENRRGVNASAQLSFAVLSIGLLFYHMLNYIQHESTLSNVAWPAAITLCSILRPTGQYLNPSRFNQVVYRRVKLAILAPIVASGIAGLGYTNVRGYISIELRNHEIIDTTVVRNLYQAFDSEKGAYYVTNLDQSLGVTSPWQKRVAVATDLKSRYRSQKNVLFISNYDALMHNSFGRPSSFAWANWYHAYSLERQQSLSEISEALDSKYLDLVVIDGDPNSFNVSQNAPASTRLVGALRKNYELLGEYPGGYMYDPGTGSFVDTSIAIWGVKSPKESNRQL